MVVIVKKVKPFSKSGHVIIPKKYVGKLAKIIILDEQNNKSEKGVGHGNRG
ncbi:DUF2080 family transposase-associated protein [Methanocaldococcus indicus]|uniref:DUF2080 family transposase-associated protein n=1 Tax=Methanocaldococcus indicus TaxID=213231 RepID=UPI003C6D2CAF